MIKLRVPMLMLFTIWNSGILSSLSFLNGFSEAP
jgi:hypothetical protein